MNKTLAAIITLVAIAACFYAVSADSTQELQPTFRLMNGEEEIGLVYGLDYGWLVVRGEEMLYTCGCDEELCNTLVVPPVVTDEPRDEPKDDPTEEPTLPPPPTVEPEPVEECKPGYGHGDDNHCHDGPPGQNK